MLNNLKKYWQNYLIGLLCLCLVFSIGLAIHYYKKSDIPNQVVSAKKILADPTVAIIDKFRDDLGQFHAEIPVNQNKITQAAIKDSSVKRMEIIHQVDDALNQVDAGHLMEVTMENLSLRAQIIKLKQDSANKALLSYQDKWLSFKYNPADSTLLDLVHDFTFSQVRYNKPRLFNPNPVLDFYADDPRVRITGAKHFTVEVPPALLGASADAKAMYDFKSGHIIPSVGLNFRIGNFHLEGRNYWSVRNQQFQQMVAASYNQPIF